MDSVTHIVLGACIGEAVAGRQLGKRALFLGALAQSVPDVDFVAAFFQGPAEEIVAHRGLTHSFLFAVVATLLLAWITKKFFRNIPIGWNHLLPLFAFNIFTHIFIDTFNAYGTGWLEPFSHQRFSFHALFVADPLFSAAPFVAAVALSYLRAGHKKRKRWAYAGILLPLFYTGYALFNKADVTNDVRRTIAQRGIEAKGFFTTPTHFNSWLWFTAIKTDSGYYTGYRSVFDKKPNMQLSYFPQNTSLLKNVRNKEDVQDLIRFAQGYYVVQQWNDTTVFSVLRFGQVVGWYNPRERFAFYYFLNHPEANELVVQRGRFEQWNRETFRSFLQRIQGE